VVARRDFLLRGIFITKKCPYAPRDTRRETIALCLAEAVSAQGPIGYVVEFAWGVRVLFRGNK